MAIAIYFLIILSSVTQSTTTKLFNKKSASPSAFNLLKTGSALLLFLVISLPDFTPHLPTLLYGMGYGASLCISMYAGYRALCLGPMALTSMLVSFSVAVPLVWGIAVREETPGILQKAALLLLFAAIICTNADKFKEKSFKSTVNKRWPVYVSITFLCNGICSVLQKEHQTAFPSLFCIEFMLFSMLFCFTVYAIISAVNMPRGTLKTVVGKRYALISGIANALANFLTLILAGLENASILFPIISAGTVLASLVCGRLMFKERLKPNQYAALALGALAIVFFKL